MVRNVSDTKIRYVPKINIGYVASEDIMPKEELTHKVYLATFDEPRYLMEIGKLIYGVEEKTYPKLSGEKGAIKKCLRKGWIKDVTDFIEIPEPKKSGFEKRRYYKAKIDPILEQIKKETPFIGSDLEIIEKILNSKAFKYLIKKQISKGLKTISINAFDFILTYFDILMIISKEYKPFVNHRNVTAIEFDYIFAINKVKRDEKMMNKIKKIAIKLFDEKNLPKNVIQDFPYLFIFPGTLIHNIHGLSEFGKKYYEMKLIFQEISKLLEN